MVTLLEWWDKIKTDNNGIQEYKQHKKFLYLLFLLMAGGETLAILRNASQLMAEKLMNLFSTCRATLAFGLQLRS